MNRDAEIRRRARKSSLAQLPKLLPPLYKRSTAESTKGGYHKQKLDKYLKVQNEMDLVGTQMRRQEKWASLIMLSARLEAFMHGPFEHRRVVLGNAVNRIKSEWRLHKLRGVIKIIAFIRVRSNIGWKLTLWMRITRKAISCTKIVDFLIACQAAKAGARILPLFQKLRLFIRKAQRMVRGYMACKHARLLLLGMICSHTLLSPSPPFSLALALPPHTHTPSHLSSLSTLLGYNISHSPPPSRNTPRLNQAKKWDFIEKQEAAILRQTTGQDFVARIKGTSAELVGQGKVLHGVGSLDRRLNKSGEKQIKFNTQKQEALFTKIRTAGRRAQNYGYDAAKYEVLSFLLRNARDCFQMEMDSVVQGVVAGREAMRAASVEAKKKGVVSKKEIENMRKMLKKGEYTNKSKISEYHFDFKMGYKGTKPPRNELPIFLVRCSRLGVFPVQKAQCTISDFCLPLTALAAFAALDTQPLPDAEVCPA
jgi:hypothetical protein